MADNVSTGQISAIQSAALSFIGDPFTDSAEPCVTYLLDAILVMEDGRISQLGPADQILPTLNVQTYVQHYRDSLMLPGFIDTHVHYPQTQIIGAGGETLIDWLEK